MHFIVYHCSIIMQPQNGVDRKRVRWYHQIMKLKDYLKTNQITSEAFAKSMGASHGGVLKWITGERFPRPKALAMIEKVTEGEVTANDFAAQQIQQQKNAS